MNQEKEIGEVFRESFSGYTPEPPAGLWDSIAHDKTLLRFNRRKWWLRAAKISAISFAPFVAVIVITTLFFPKAPKDDTSTVTPDQVTHTTSVTTPSPAPIAVVENTQPVTHTPQQPQTPNDIVVPQATDNQKETATETVTCPEPVSSPVEPAKPMDLASYNPKNNHEDARFEEDEGMSLSMSMPNYIHPEPKSGRSGQIEYSKDTSVCRNSQLTLFVRNAMNVQWNIGVQGESVTIYPEEPLLITATITTFDKIDTTIYIQVGVFDCGLWIPTAFTPNGDGLNDEFIVHAPSAITHYECAIYDRSRGLLFRTNNIQQGWDGSFNGKPLPLGAYFYVITYRDEAGVKHVEKGQITLIR